MELKNNVDRFTIVILSLLSFIRRCSALTKHSISHEYNLVCERLFSRHCHNMQVIIAADRTHQSTGTDKFAYKLVYPIDVVIQEIRFIPLQ